VSVVVPNYNGASFLGTCLDSIRAQTYEPLDAIVVDDGSTDESAALVSSTYPEMRLVRLPRNRGFAYAANRGIEAARGEIVALLNNDAVADPRWAEELVSAFRRHPEAGAVASKILLLDRPNVINAVGDEFGRNGLPRNRGAWQEDAGQFDQEAEVFGASGAAVGYRKTMLADIGLFDERFFMYCEDVDLAFRAQLAGYRCVYAPPAVVHHRLSASGGGTLASYFCGRNFIWLLARDLPAAAWRHHWPRIVAAHVRLVLHQLAHAREPAARARLRGVVAGLWTAPERTHERSTIHRDQTGDARLLGLLT